ncbi:hypothetical protein AB8A05_29675 [Tardiphaga sp. 538_B7_N1_4]|uniref:hypothetical protein n=1 Tax=Tardiphaga sp. 538_B7_N1_4 TaxID=3240778 RepID=UPI003F2965DF
MRTPPGALALPHSLIGANGSLAIEIDADLLVAGLHPLPAGLQAHFVDDVTEQALALPEDAEW